MPPWIREGKAYPERTTAETQRVRRYQQPQFIAEAPLFPAALSRTSQSDYADKIGLSQLQHQQLRDKWEELCDPRSGLLGQAGLYFLLASLPKPLGLEILDTSAEGQNGSLWGQGNDLTAKGTAELNIFPTLNDHCTLSCSYNRGQPCRGRENCVSPSRVEFNGV